MYVLRICVCMYVSPGNSMGHVCDVYMFCCVVGDGQSE